jgi:hypothetical protein
VRTEQLVDDRLLQLAEAQCRNRLRVRTNIASLVDLLVLVAYERIQITSAPVGGCS